MMKQLCKSILYCLGYELRRRPAEYQWNYDAFQDQKRLLIDKDVKIILDVGANTGQTANRYRHMFPRATIHCFEPTKDVFIQLQNEFDHDERVQTHQVAIAEASGVRQFFLNEYSPTNSLLPRDDRCSRHWVGGYVSNVSTTQVPAITIDEFCENNNISTVDILKMDIQGSELLALKGSQKLLQRHSLSLIYCEVIFSPIYENQTSLDQLIRLLEQYNYRLFGIYEIAHDGQYGLMQADVIFIRSDLMIS